MRQLTDRISPWAPTMLATGLLGTLAESLAEGDITSIALLLMGLIGAGFVLRANRGLTRGEVRAEIDAGIRARVQPEVLIDPPRVIPRRSLTVPEPSLVEVHTPESILDASASTLEVPKVSKEVP